jgi:uncharacterized membrane protein YcaP (DUF421 family)
VHPSIVNSLFTIGIPIAEKAIRTAAVYAGILLLLRLGGKRDLAQLNSFDLVVLLLLSNVVQNSIIGEDNSLAGGLLGAALLVGLNAVVVRVSRLSDWAMRIFEGDATVLVRDGEIDHGVLRRLGLRKGDVVNALRRQGANNIDEVEEASLQPGGAIVVKLKEPDENATRGDIRRLEEKLDQLLAAGGRVGTAREEPSA